ncbi:hypothetical protein [Parasporobacterium paucivorans]|uniref:N-terminal TM domain of oligopeptide transport permease C n=1 Tax=Parasporobacterium paucivorans DSM 15970 TaxID=1122934 RepID=A0A1M6D8U9_9FIRM|nr:hypothetical protein [Parasporobacterium paucivorans]SHI69633.1 N-terminal TM domain of oligopeptide transport permease C [Parasporobacterium paucivorans DSM 15970]
MKKRNLNLIIGFVLTGIVILLAIIGNFWTPYDPLGMSLELKNIPPGGQCH